MAEIELATADQVERRLEVTKGIIEEPIDLDSARGVEDVGFYTARGVNIVNGPSDITGNPVCDIVIRRNTSNGVYQSITCFQGHWWRVANGNSSWHPWVRGFTSGDAERLSPVVSSDEYAPLTDGGTLLVFDPNDALTVFSDPFTDGGFTYQWADGESMASAFQWVDRGDGRGEARMMNNNLRRALTWDRFDGIQDVEVQMMVFVSSVRTAFGLGAAARLSGSLETRTAVVAGLSGGTGGAVINRLILWEFNAGGSRTIGQVDFPFDEGDEVNVKLRVEGSLVAAKAWRVDDPEPSHWQLDGETNISGPGSAGVYAYSSYGRYRALGVKEL